MPYTQVVRCPQSKGACSIHKSCVVPSRKARAPVVHGLKLRITHDTVLNLALYTPRPHVTSAREATRGRERGADGLPCVVAVAENGLGR
eukprot:6610350-Prymnesium_polylepis.1